MKFQFVLLLVLALVSPSAFAEKGNIIKLFDGKFAQCIEAKHAGYKAYLPNGLTAKSDASTLSVAFILEHLKCEQTRESVVWAPNPHPLDPTPSKDLDDHPILIKQTNVEAVLSRGGGDASALSIVNVEDASEQAFHFAFGMDQFLSRSELGALDAGSPVEARATFFLRSDVSVQTHTGETVVLGRRSGGAYTIFLTLKKADGEIQVVSVELK